MAGGVLERLGQARLEAMAGATATVEALSEDERAGLVRAIVVCVPPEKAETMLEHQAASSPGGRPPGRGHGALGAPHRPRHTGGRFSPKAAMPSAASSVLAVTVRSGCSSRRLASTSWSHTA